MAIVAERTLAVITTWPTGMVRSGLVHWLYRLGLGQEQIAEICTKPIVVAKSIAIRDALRTPYDTFIFADNDMVPHPRMIQPFVDAEQDLVCANFAIADMAGWGDPQAFHMGLWRTTRKVLETVGPPWFETTYTDDGCAVAKCNCMHLRDKVLCAGFTVGRAGWAEHKGAAHSA